MDETIISWNVPNWITIVLMVLVGYMVWATLSRVVTNRAKASA